MNDLQKLDAYLSSDDSPEDCLMLSDLDGFITGIVCSPEEILPAECLPIALGDVNGVPERVISAVLNMHQNINIGLGENPPIVEPIFWQAAEGHVVAMDWCEGFLQAVSLRPKEWLPLNESKHGPALMTPIMVHMIDEDGNSVMGIDQRELDEILDQAAERIPDVVAGIYQFWWIGRANRPTNG